MEIQLKKGLLEVCVLASIRTEATYGYKIIKDVSPYIEISESTLYPILKRLESAKAVESYTMEYQGRLRKYYKITGIGIKRLQDFLDEWKEIMKIYEYIEGGV